jgi:hypothetical protein
LDKVADGYNQYFKAHPWAKVEMGKATLQQRAQKPRISEWVSMEVNERTLSVHIDAEALERGLEIWNVMF